MFNFRHLALFTTRYPKGTFLNQARVDGQLTRMEEFTISVTEKSKPVVFHFYLTVEELWFCEKHQDGNSTVLGGAGWNSLWTAFKSALEYTDVWRDHERILEQQQQQQP